MPQGEASAEPPAPRPHFQTPDCEETGLRCLGNPVRGPRRRGWPLSVLRDGCAPHVEFPLKP